MDHVNTHHLLTAKLFVGEKSCVFVSRCVCPVELIHPLAGLYTYHPSMVEHHGTLWYSNTAMDKWTVPSYSDCCSFRLKKSFQDEVFPLIAERYPHLGLSNNRENFDEHKFI